MGFEAPYNLLECVVLHAKELWKTSRSIGLIVAWKYEDQVKLVSEQLVNFDPFKNVIEYVIGYAESF